MSKYGDSVKSMRNKQIANGASRTIGTGTGIENMSEVDALLSQLLPQVNEVLEFAPVSLDSIPYKDIRRVRLNNGVRAVEFPDGTRLARALDRKSGNVFWMRVRT